MGGFPLFRGLEGAARAGLAKRGRLNAHVAPPHFGASARRDEKGRPPAGKAARKAGGVEKIGVLFSRGDGVQYICVVRLYVLLSRSERGL